MRRRKSLRSAMYVNTAAPTANAIPQVSALSPQGSRRRTALWQVVEPPSAETHNAGHKVTRTTVAPSHGISLRTLAR
jgi:hypothetical protein